MISRVSVVVAWTILMLLLAYAAAAAADEEQPWYFGITFSIPGQRRVLVGPFDWEPLCESDRHMLAHHYLDKISCRPGSRSTRAAYGSGRGEVPGVPADGA